MKHKVKLTKIRALGIFLIFISIAAILFAAFYSSPKSQQTLVFSDKLMLSELWTTYKSTFIEKDSYRTLDKERDNITTSEGQSYSMLRSVWMDDKTTFDKSWKWTKENIQRKDKLFSWLYGKKTDGTYGILTDQGGENTATDADSDIAMSLIFAFKRWQDPQYLTEAKEIIKSIWSEEVIIINNKPVLTSNNIEKKSTTDLALLNPSYFAPYSYKIFSQYDNTNNWLALSDNSYSIINETLDNKFNKRSTAHIPVDWISINKKSGELTYNEKYSNLTTNYSYDALRLPWRLALDWKWNKETKAKATLDKMNFFTQQYNSNKLLNATYDHEGSPTVNYESPAFYGGTIGYFAVSDPNTAEDVYKSKLELLYDPNALSWKKPLSYYDDNWAWFGIALYTDSLHDLSK